jgi:hypothetical protein
MSGVHLTLFILACFCLFVLSIVFLKWLQKRAFIGLNEEQYQLLTELNECRKEIDIERSETRPDKTKLGLLQKKSESICEECREAGISFWRRFVVY